MRGEDVKDCRERKGASQAEFATWLNERLGRRYDKQRVSRWEVGSERIPASVMTLVAAELRVLTSTHGPALTTVVAIQKGGCAKTISAVNIATILARRGFRVLLVDVDPQANATINLGIDPLAVEREKRSLAHVLKDEAAIGDVIVTIESSGLEVLPSSPSLSVTESEIAADNTGPFDLRERLVDLKRVYDHIVIDTPPNLGAMTLNGLAAADSVLVPCQTEMLAIAGVGLLLTRIEKLKRRFHPNIKIAGILPTLYNARLAQHQAGLEAITEQYGTTHRIFPAVPWATTYGESVMAGRAAVETTNNLRGAEAYEKVVDLLVEERKRIVQGVSNAA